MRAPKPLLITELLLMMPVTAQLILATPLIPFALAISTNAASPYIFAALFAYFAGAYGILTFLKGFRTLWKGGAIGRPHVRGLLCGLAAAGTLIAILLIQPTSGHVTSKRPITPLNLMVFFAPMAVALHWLYLIKKGSRPLPNPQR